MVIQELNQHESSLDYDLFIARSYMLSLRWMLDFIYDVPSEN
jgi:hypothetical protein